MTRNDRLVPFFLYDVRYYSKASWMSWSSSGSTIEHWKDYITIVSYQPSITLILVGVGLSNVQSVQKTFRSKWMLALLTRCHSFGDYSLAIESVRSSSRKWLWDVGAASAIRPGRYKTFQQIKDLTHIIVLYLLNIKLYKIDISSV